MERTIDDRPYGYAVAAVYRDVPVERTIDDRLYGYASERDEGISDAETDTFC